MANLPLNDFLERATTRSWGWGTLDCCLFIADWVQEETGIDPAAEYRGTYCSERQARDLVKTVGGPERLLQRCLAHANCTRTEHPQRGDVGLVMVGAKRWRDRILLLPTAAICVRPKMWAVKATDSASVLIQNFPVRAAWTFRHG